MKTRPNILWITLESVRYDHTSLSGYGRDTTPALARLASDPRATAFEQCITHGKWTGTSSGSILTGQYPDTVERMQSYAEQWLSSRDSRTTGTEAELDEATKAHLSDMGYLV